MKKIRNLIVVVPKNEDSDNEASIRVATDNEKETVKIFKNTQWGDHDSRCVEFPRQFLVDVKDAIVEVIDYLHAEHLADQ